MNYDDRICMVYLPITVMFYQPVTNYLSVKLVSSDCNEIKLPAVKPGQHFHLTVRQHATFKSGISSTHGLK